MIIGQKRLDVNSKINSKNNQDIDLNEIINQISNINNNLKYLNENMGQLYTDYNSTKPYVFKNKYNIEVFQSMLRNNYTTVTGGYNYTHTTETHLTRVSFNNNILPISIKICENSGEIIECFPVINFEPHRTNGVTIVSFFNKGDIDYSSKQIYLQGIDINNIGEDY